MIAAIKRHLVGELVSFSPLQIDNIYKHFEWNNDIELNRLDSEMPFVRESFGDFKRRFERLVYEPSQHEQDFEIHATDGTLIGIAYLSGISKSNAHCTCGITIGDRNYWGKGYGRDSLRILLEYCFEDLAMHRVMAETFEYNDAWKQLVNWAGFEREGLMRDYLQRDDRYWSKELYVLFDNEYKPLSLEGDGFTADRNGTLHRNGHAGTNGHI